jgi:magnesium transporter
MFGNLRKLAKRSVHTPGVLSYVGDASQSEPARITVYEYGPDGASVREQVPVGELVKPVGARSGASAVTWIDVSGVADTDTVAKVGEIFGLHQLLVEDIVHTCQRPKVEDMDEYLFVVVKALAYDEKTSSVSDRQVSLVLGDGYVLMFRDNGGEEKLANLRDRIVAGKGKVRKMGADYLLYVILDGIVDNYFLVLERIGEDIEEMETRLLAKPSASELENIHVLKRETLMFRKYIFPLREVIARLQSGESRLIGDSLKFYLKDLYDHTIQAMDSLETLRDILSGMIDIYLSNISLRLNEIMKVLTIISTFFIPMSFVAGVYGMNFENMPELKWPYGYPMALGIMVLIAGGLLTYYKKKKWL